MYLRYIMMRYALSSTVTEYDFFGTTLRLIAWKDAPFDWLHKEVTERDRASSYYRRKQVQET